mgnify:FL=1
MFHAERFLVMSASFCQLSGVYGGMLLGLSAQTGLHQASVPTTLQYPNKLLGCRIVAATNALYNPI